MRLRRLLLGAGTVALVGLAFFAVLWLTTPARGVTWENFRRLRPGMSVTDVEALLGESYSFETFSGTQRVWHGEEVVIFLYFDAGVLKAGEGHPVGDSFISGHGGEHIRPHESLLDRIRRRLHW